MTSHAYSKASYSLEPEKNKAESCAYSKASYSLEPGKKKAASHAYSKAQYNLEPGKKKSVSKARYKKMPPKRIQPHMHTILKTKRANVHLGRISMHSLNLSLL